MNATIIFYDTDSMGIGRMAYGIRGSDGALLCADDSGGLQYVPIERVKVIAVAISSEAEMAWHKYKSADIIASLEAKVSAHESDHSH